MCVAQYFLLNRLFLQPFTAHFFFFSFSLSDTLSLLGVWDVKEEVEEEEGILREVEEGEGVAEWSFFEALKGVDSCFLDFEPGVGTPTVSSTNP